MMEAQTRVSHSGGYGGGGALPCKDFFPNPPIKTSASPMGHPHPLNLKMKPTPSEKQLPAPIET